MKLRAVLQASANEENLIIAVLLGAVTLGWFSATAKERKIKSNCRVWQQMVLSPGNGYVLLIADEDLQYFVGIDDGVGVVGVWQWEYFAFFGTVRVENTQV